MIKLQFLNSGKKVVHFYQKEKVEIEINNHQTHNHTDPQKSITQSHKQKLTKIKRQMDNDI